MTASKIAKVLGIAKPADWDAITAEGYWFRVQPRGLGLDHQTECSDGSLASGVHVLATLAQAVLQEGAWQMAGHELIVIAGPANLHDSGDVEGWLLPSGTGEIVARCDFDRLTAEYNAR